MPRGSGRRALGRVVRLPDGDSVTACPMCEATPVRASWLRVCAECGLAVCRVCMDERSRFCLGCAHALGLPLTIAQATLAAALEAEAALAEEVA